MYTDDFNDILMPLFVKTTSYNKDIFYCIFSKNYYVFDRYNSNETKKEVLKYLDTIFFNTSKYDDAISLKYIQKDILSIVFSYFIHDDTIADITSFEDFELFLSNSLNYKKLFLNGSEVMYIFNQLLKNYNK